MYYVAFVWLPFTDLPIYLTVIYVQVSLQSSGTWVAFLSPIDLVSFSWQATGLEFVAAT